MKKIFYFSKDSLIEDSLKKMQHLLDLQAIQLQNIHQHQSYYNTA